MNDKEEAIERIAKEIGLPKKVVEQTILAFWKYVKVTLETLPIKDTPANQLDSLRASINVPSLGKLYCNKKKVKICKFIKNGYNKYN